MASQKWAKSRVRREVANSQLLSTAAIRTEPLRRISPYTATSR